MSYDAFLSYSSRDALAVSRLHRIIEAYRPPRSAKTEKKRLRVFRYEEDQVVTQDLEHRVRQADALILAASKHAAASDKVALETTTFAKARGIEKLFPVLVADTIEEGIPEALKAELRDPIWVDARSAALPPFAWMFAGKRRCKAALLPLIAKLLGADPDDLIARDQRRRVLRRVAVAALLVLLFGAAARVVLRTPARAWMATDYERFGRPISEASVMHAGGRESLRVLTHWTQRESDDAIGRDLVMELDTNGHQTGVVGGGSIGDGMWVETKHTKELGPAGTLTADLERVTNGNPKYLQFLPPDYIRALLPPAQPQAGFDGAFLATSKNAYYAAMPAGEDDSGHTTDLLRSDDGLSWRKLDTKPAAGLQLTGLAVSSGRNPIVALSASSVNMGPSGPVQAHILTTADDGAHWSDLTAGIPQAPRATLAGVTSDGHVAALFGEGKQGGSLAIWRPLTLAERIKGRIGLQR
jgi:hypothetical protein